MDKHNSVCPNCRQHYYLKTLAPKNVNLPLFLPCGHTMCENCVISIVKGEVEPLKCSVCLTMVDTCSLSLNMENMEEIYDKFPVNFNTLGEVAFGALKKLGTGAKEENHYIDLKKIISDLDRIEGKCIECTRPSLKCCHTCSKTLCEDCFKKTHNFLVFKDHVLQNLEIQMKPKNCETHINKVLNYFCYTCNKQICIDCLMPSTAIKFCKNHESAPIEEAQQQFKEELTELVPKVDIMYRRLTKTAVEVGNLLYQNSTSAEFSTLFENIDQSFSQLTASVQKHKNDVVNIINEMENTRKASLIVAKNDLQQYITNAKKYLNIINNNQKLSSPALCIEGKKIIEGPWYLQTGGESADGQLKPTINKELCSLISNYVRLERNVAQSFRLVTTAELPPDSIPQPPSAPVFPPETPTAEPRIDPVDGLRAVPVAVADHETFPQESTQELVEISHIVDPHNFFVQKSSHQKYVQMLLLEFGSCREGNFARRPSIKYIQPGMTYAMFKKADSAWRRCRVLSIESSAKYKVFCYDYGDIEIVFINDLRLLPSQFVNRPPPLALNCCLFNCEPISGAWTNNDAILMQNFINNKSAVINIRRVLPSSEFGKKLECDVTSYEDGTNIAHALVFHDRARMRLQRVKYPDIVTRTKKCKILIRDDDFERKTKEKVFITNVVSPDKLFVRRRQFKTVYEKLSKDLEKEYGANDSMMYLPEVGTSCVAHVICGEESCWERGIVREHCGRQRVRLFLPDCGFEVAVHYSQLRHITEPFTGPCAMANECHLAGIAPFNKKWDPNSVQLMQEFQGRQLDLVVVEEGRGESIGVTLRTDDDPTPVCLNLLMIERKFAIPIRDFNFEEDLENAKDDGSDRVEVKLLNFQSPSLIYVSMVCQQKTFSELSEEMQKYYSKQTCEKTTQWAVGDRCCAHCADSGNWRRAVILQIDRREVKVFYTDFASTEIVHTSALRVLPEHFAALRDAAIECHMSGVSPAAGDDWTSSTEECLRDTLDAYQQLFITKVDEIKDKSMPVQLWVYHTTHGAALDPNVSEWRCLNRFLVEQGLAISDKSLEVPELTDKEPVAEPAQPSTSTHRSTHRSTPRSTPSKTVKPK